MLPEGLRTLIEESFAMHDRIIQLDRAMSASRDPDLMPDRPANPVAQQMGMLERAFAAKLS
jgi:regulator of CtrA degradation